MPVEESSTAGPDGNPARWDSACAAVHMYEFDAAQKAGCTQRAFAEERGIPPTTLQDWLRLKGAIAAAPELVAFFESPTGVAFLKRMVLAAHVVS